MGISQYPIDFDSVEKGQVFTPERLEEIIGKPNGSKSYCFGVMALASLIQLHTGFTTRITELGLRVLTDAEATDRNHSEFHRHQRGMKRRNELMLNVATENLSDEQARAHDRRLISQSRTLQAIQWAGCGRSLPGAVDKAIAADDGLESIPA